ncbi:cell division ATP-binding protein FtsE [Candidatus Saccharibacteria bacterium]|nr:cell division ATP-binding protein FtsE [Candidatus Saccharibacteria bacterium]
MILLDNISKYYPGDKVPALDQVTLNVQPKEFVFLVGKSGAGKSTLIKMLTREEKPTSGKIMVGGIDYDYLQKRHIPHLRRRLGVVFQDFKLLPNRTVYENVAFALEIVGVSNKEIRRTVPKVLELVGLSDKSHKFPSELSGGERQRVAIARSMARQPKILIADEPTGNLDPETSWGIVRLLEEINNFGTTILVTTHDEKIVNQLKKRVLTIRDGKLIGDQKDEGHYDLDATSTAPPKRPLAPLPKKEPSQPTVVAPMTNEELDAARDLSSKVTIQTKAESANTANTAAEPSAPSTTRHSAAVDAHASALANAATITPAPPRAVSPQAAHRRAATTAARQAAAVRRAQAAANAPKAKRKII